MKRLGLIFLLFKGIFLFAQEDAIPEIFPSSPTASELGKFGSYPMDLSTGLPKIEIPLYTIEVGDLSIPITMRYHASGIKVNQMPSWVGLGWSLDTGGLISLDVRDTPDEVEPTPYAIPSQAYLDYNIFPYPYNFLNPYLENVTKNSWVKDAYQISLPTVSGTFYLGSTNSADGIEKFPPDKYVVEKDIPISSGLPGAPFKFLIKDKQGIQYFFKDVEQSEMLKTNNQPGDDTHIFNKKYTSAWLPGIIMDTKGNSVNYVYGNTYTIPSRGETHSQTYSYTEGSAVGQPSYSASIQPWKVGLSKSLNYANKPTEINFSNGRIRFVMGSNSLFDGVKDAPGKFLQKIIIESGNSTVGYNIIKTIMFEYSITGSALSGKYRYKLDKILEWHGINDQEQKEIASFEYSSTALPKMGSYSVDFFGYYNGKNNINLIPAKVIQYKPTQYGGEVPETIGAADRSVNTNFMEAGMLTKITYPTKGYTTFEYEANSYYGFNQTLQEEYKSESIALFGEGDGSQNPNNILCIDETCVIKSQQVSLPANSATTLRITGNSICSNCNNMNSKYSYAKVWLNGSLIFSGYYNSSSIDFSVNLPAGNNSLLAKVYGDRMTLHLNLGYWNPPGPGTYENIKGFGLRNNKIVNYDSNGMFINKKVYDFTIPGTTQSSGMLLNGNLEFENLKSFRSSILYSCEGGLTHTNTRSYTHSSSSKTGFENNHIAYEYVTEIEEDSLGTSIGKTIYQFSAVPDLTTAVPAIWLSQGYKRGSVLKKEVFDQQDRILVKEESFYSEDSILSSSRLDFNAEITAFSDFDPYDCSGLIPYNVQYELQYFYTYLTSRWYKKNRTEVTNFFYNGGLTEEVKISYDYFYDPRNQEVEKVVTTDSNGDIIEKILSYAHHKNDQRLIDENRIVIPLETRTLKNSEVIEDHLTKYRSFGALYLPEAVYRKKAGLVDQTSTIDRTIKFMRYDSKGNPLEVSRETGPSTVYIWGYNKQYPIAKIENATYAEVANALNISVLSLDGFSEANLLSFNDLRTNVNFSKPMITTYSYFPLIGVSSITDPRGNINTFHYDLFGRLHMVKDVDENLLTQYKYKYKTN